MLPLPGIVIQVLGPFLVDPVLAEKPWGGRNLERFGKSLPDGLLIGESWEIADLPVEATTTVADPRSVIRTGPMRGSTIREVLDAVGSEFLGSATPEPDGSFPLLVKLLDAGQHLSVQVHPTEAYVALHPGSRLKTESWYVVDAAPGAVLFLDLVDGVSRDDLTAVIGTPDLPVLLQQVPAIPGDFYHIPAGTVHALGAGVMVAEVQTPSDTTFRMYDWSIEYGRALREMHVAEALEAVVIHPPGMVRSERDGSSLRPLISNRHYWMIEHLGAGVVPLDPMTELRILMVVAGRVTVEGLEADAGDTVVVPAGVAGPVEVRTDPRTVLLEVGLGLPEGGARPLAFESA